MKNRIPILAAALVLVVMATPVAACLAMVHEAPVAERAHTGCDSSPDAPAATLCADSGTVVQPRGFAPSPAPVAIEIAPASCPGLDGDVAPPPAGIRSLAPTARSAPIHLLHQTFLI